MKVWRKIRTGYDALQPMLPGLMAGANIRRTLTTPTEQALEQARGRLAFTGAMFVIVFSVIGLRLIDVMALTPGGDGGHRITTSQSSSGRANLVDRNGLVLAASLPTVSVCADAKNLIDPAQAIKQLMGVLPDLDEQKLLDDIQTRKRCVMIRRHLTPRQHEAVNKLGIPGLEYLHDERRVYPAGESTAHLVGYTDIDNIGIAGVEKSLDQQLRQEQDPVALSIDVRIQHILHNELVDSMQNFRAIGAAGMVLDIKTGELLALASLPDFDPHRSGTASGRAKYNMATAGVYELGSIFKIFTMAMALDSGEVKVTDSFDAGHPITIGRQTISDFHPENRWLTVPEIMIYSSNIGAARMADKVGGLRQRKFLEELGMFKSAQLELPEVGKPLVPDNWGEATTMTVSFGHGLAISPLQLVAATATIVNDGHKVTPTLLRQNSARATDNNEQIISAATSAKVRALMRLVVSEGTAKQADADGYLVGGKTGTAEKITSGGYNRDARISSFVGVFPLNQPRYVVFVMLDEPKGNEQTYGYATAGWVAAPAVGRIISAAGPLLGVPPLDAAAKERAETALLKPLGTRLSANDQKEIVHDQLASLATADQN
jgi:cell division protein FtsI (penicillin-binding protein 3)